jgi:hypothetical protein
MIRVKLYHIIPEIQRNKQRDWIIYKHTDYISQIPEIDIRPNPKFLIPRNAFYSALQIAFSRHGVN